MNALSPELVLVDPVLATEARRLLPDPPDCLAIRERAPRPDAGGRIPATVARSLAARLSITAGSAPFPGAAAPAANVALGLVLQSAPSLAPPYRWQAETASPSTTIEAPEPRARPSLLAVVLSLFVALAVGLPSLDLVPWSAAERPSFVTEVEPRAEAVVLEWPRVVGADFYDVVLWRDGRRVLDLWPEANRVDVLAAVGASGNRLDPGRYQWFAFAGFGSRAEARFGKPLANGAFTIAEADAQP